MITRFAVLAALAAGLVAGQGALAQSGNGLQPAEHPPEGFEGNRFVDSEGCVFLRSTFGGEVSWIPLFGADSRPVCNGDPKTAPMEEAAAVAEAGDATDPDTAVMTEAVMADADEDGADEAETVAAEADRPEAASEPEADRAEAPAPEPEADRAEAPAPERQIARPAAPVAAAQAAVKSPPAVQPRRTARAARPSPAPAQVQHPSGRHAACPAQSPYGELVTVADGRRMVRCVIAPELMLRAGVHDPAFAAGAATVVAAAAGPRAAHAAPAPVTPRASLGAYVQVGSFAVPANAQRTRARLVAEGLPVAVQRARAAGRALDVVLVGPVERGNGLHQTLRIVRAMGFSDAFIRR